MKKKLIIIIPILFIIITSGVLFIYCYYETEKVANYLDGKEVSALISQVSNQEIINKRLNRIANQKKYTFNDAYVELNPYKISPLSALIIFNSNKASDILVFINGEYFTTLKGSKKNIIPIYGLYEDYENVIKLIRDGEEKEYIIKTEKSNIEYPLNVLEASNKLTKNDIYFTVASYKTYLTGWDYKGNLRFYLKSDNRMDVEWLDNGHFIIGTTQDQSREQFCGFVEMDYLGKIYNYYTLENGFSFESQVLSDGNIMIAGGNEAIYMDEQVVYILNPKDGKKVSEINLSKIIEGIDENFNPKYLGAGAIRNGFYYNEETNELLVSFRDINSVFSFDYAKKQLNWVFVSPDNELFKNDVWKNYLIKIKSGRYPLGQHTPQITKDGNIAIFNNGYDRYSVYELNKSDKVSEFKNAYSSCEVYKIKNKTASLVWEYNNKKSMFSIKYGLFRYNDDNTKLMNFGYILNDKYMSNPNNSIKESENLIDSMYSLIIELDSKDQIVFKATCEEGKYRVFKHKLYSESTKSVDVKQYNIMNNIKNDKLTISDHKKIDLEETSEWIYDLEFTKNTFTTNYDIKENDNIDIYLVNKTGKIYILNYKKKNNKKLKRVFNVEVPKGKYGLYININGVIYNPKLIVKF